MANWATRLAKLAQALATAGTVPETSISTSETDTDLRLAPDGTGGVEWGTGGAGGAPDCKTSVITADVTMGTANTWTDSGLTLSLETGTWLVQAKLMIRTTQTGLTGIGARVCNSDASTVYDNSFTNLLSNNGQENMLNLLARITLGATTTVKVQGIDVVRTAVICADSADAAVTDNVISQMTALAVTSA
jgi:hypothetical protein